MTNHNLLVIHFLNEVEGGEFGNQNRHSEAQRRRPARGILNNEQPSPSPSCQSDEEILDKLNKLIS